MGGREPGAGGRRFGPRGGNSKSADFAATKGFAVAGWHQYSVPLIHESLAAFYDGSKNADVVAASQIAPARELQVLFRSPDQSHEFRVYLSQTGQVTGYDFGKSSKQGVTDADDGSGIRIQSNSDSESDDTGPKSDQATAEADNEAGALARRAFAANTTLARLVPLGPAKVRANKDDAMGRDITWDAQPVGNGEVTLKISASVRDSQVVAQRVVASVGDAHAVAKPKLPMVLNSFYAFFLTIGAVYAIYRYAKRSLQKEVSHLRTLVVAALFTVSYTTLIYAIAWDQVAVHVTGQTFVQIGLIGIVASVIVFAIMGLLVGIGYGSGEGELREAYPGKLTSLDALLAGRIFSQDVGASVLFGAAAAGWLLLCHHALTYFLNGDVVASRDDVLRYTFARFPWSSLLLGRQYDSLLIAVAGLLLPARFLWRGASRKKMRFVWLIVFALFSVLHDAAKYPTFPAELVAAVIFVAALLLPFFLFDLLAAMVSLSALGFVDELVRLNAVFTSWTHFSIGLAFLTAAILAAAAYLALRGRRVREEAVRPLYAKNLAERMGMQAELLAAREAQLRLLPQAAPDLPGTQFAACCLPARGVGGDFYDFFRLDSNRVGIFVAQGGEQGLASALCIALAKGILMHASLQSHSPTQILIELEASIAELLEGGSGGGISFAYGVMDTRRSVLTYARLGALPKFVIYRHGSGLAPSAQLERVVIVPNRPKNAPQIYEGTAHAQPGDHLIFFTGGVTSIRVKRFGKREYQWLDFLMRQLTLGDEPLQVSLVSALSKYQNRASDDLTAVVIRMIQSEAILQEVVA